VSDTDTVSINDARAWFLAYPEHRDDYDGHPELTTAADIVLPTGERRGVTLCVTYFDNQVPDDEGVHIGVQMQLAEDDDETLDWDLLDIMHGNEDWTLDLICQVFRIHPDARVWDKLLN
jgi:hypothetical protein